MPGRSRGGNAAGNFHPSPGPLRGSPAPAKATAGAPTIGQDHWRGAGKAPYIYFTRCRPSAPLPDCSRQGGSLTIARRESGRGNGEAYVCPPCVTDQRYLPYAIALSSQGSEEIAGGIAALLYSRAERDRMSGRSPCLERHRLRKDERNVPLRQDADLQTALEHAPNQVVAKHILRGA